MTATAAPDPGWSAPARSTSRASRDASTPRGEPLPSLRDRSVWCLLALVAALQALAWSRIEGYQIADSVEFMERARILVRGQEMVDAGAIRPFGFSTALIPFFALADWFGLADPRAQLWAICLLQNALGLALVVAVARLGARLVDRRAGLVAGLLVGTNPVFLQYSTQPVSGIAGALCVALGTSAVLERSGFRKSLAGGLWFGVALLMAYHSIAILLIVAAIVLVRDRRRALASAGGLFAGAAIGVLVQGLLDKVVYGRFGASLWNYVVQNVFSVLTSVALKVLRFARERSFEALEDGATRAAHFFYDVQTAASGGGRYELAEDLSVRGLQGPWYYLENLPQMLVWPVIGLLLLAMLRLVRRPEWKAGLLFLAFAANVALLSNKGSKDFRLWLPLLPFVMPLCAFGGAVLWSTARARLAPVQVVSAALVLATAVAFSLEALLALETRGFRAYWAAIDWVNERAEEDLPARERAAGGTPARLRVGSAYNWAIYMRESPLVELVKLPWQLNLWHKYDAVQKADDFEALEELDVFVTHLPILQENPDLLAWIAGLYQVEAAFYDQATDAEELGGPVLVLARRDGGPRARTFFDLRPPEPAEAFRARLGLDCEAHFVEYLLPRADGTLEREPERLVLLGLEYQELPPDGYGWITYHWTTPTGLGRDYTLVDRLTSPDEHNAWQNNHSPAYGVHPTSTWRPGEILSEGFLVVPASEPFKPDAFFRPLGGGYRRGDLIPVTVWMAIVEYDAEELARGNVLIRSRLHASRPGERSPIHLAPGEYATGDGYQFSEDRLFQVGRFLLPVPPAAALPDDGRPVPE